MTTNLIARITALAQGAAANEMDRFYKGDAWREFYEEVERLLAAALEQRAEVVGDLWPADFTVEGIDRFEAAISDLGPATVQVAAWVCALARAALAQQARPQPREGFVEVPVWKCPHCWVDRCGPLVACKLPDCPNGEAQ